MDLFKHILTPKEGLYFRSTFKDLHWFGKHIGDAKIYDKGIMLNNYPHPPSPYYKSGFIKKELVKAIYLEGSSVSIMVDSEIIFFHDVFKEKLQIFAEMNRIPLSLRNSNWEYITEPFLNFEMDELHKRETLNLLKQRGFSLQEVQELRKLVEKQMMKYNFDTQLMKSDFLSLHDVLLAMKPALSKADFVKFYWKAMEIEMRAK